MTEPIVTKHELVNGLRTLGVTESVGVLEVHASLSSLGFVVGGVQTLVEALQAAIGQDGTIVVLAGWQDRPPYEQKEWAERDTFQESCPAFEPLRSRAEKQFGVLANSIRTWPGARHSYHPVCSFSAIGRRAAELMADQPDQGYGPGSPLEKMYDARGSVLLLGAPLYSATFLHFAEYKAELEAKRYIEYEMPVYIDGKRTWKRFRELDSSNGAIDFPHSDMDSDEFEAIVRDAVLDGVGVEGRVANAHSTLLPMVELLPFARTWIENHASHPGGS